MSADGPTPPENVSPVAEPVAAPQAPVPVTPENSAADKQPSAPAPAAAATKDRSTEKPAQRRQYGPTRSGQTLAQITKEVQIDKTVDFYQLLYAIFLTNPEAFDNNNINGLKKGAMLTIPNGRDISHVDAAVAKEKIAQHTAQWRSAQAPVTAPAKPKTKTKAELETALQEVNKFAAENKELADRLASTEERIKALLEQNRIRDEKLRKIAEKIQEPQ